MTSLGKMMAGGGNQREDYDFYPTPSEVTLALLEAESHNLRTHKFIWEPACGDGAISDVLKDHGHFVISTDIVERGYGGQVARCDFLLEKEMRSQAIITNPPFILAEEFIRHAKTLGISYLALLLKSTYWHAAGRYPLWNEWRPAAIYPLTWRPDFLEKGAPTMEASWVVWRGKPLQTIYQPLPKPVDQRQGNLQW